MLGDLETQKLMQGLDRFSILAADDDPGACLCLFVPIVNLVFQFDHHRHAGWRLVMHEHRDVEVAGLKSMIDVLEVLLNLRDADLVVGGVGEHLDYAAVFAQQKMVRGFVLSKAHALVTAHVHFVVRVLVLS